MGLFKKRIGGVVTPPMDPDRLANSIKFNSNDVKASMSVTARSVNYNLLYRDGQYLGIPFMEGGSIYPFSVDPRKKGSNGQKKKFNEAEIVTIAKDFTVKVLWGTKTPFTIEDPKTHKPYKITARGVFFVNIDPTDSARSANLFYSKVLSLRNLEEFRLEQLRDFLADAFVNRIGAKIQEYIEASGRSLENYVGLMPSEIVKISEDLCPKMGDIFGHFGLAIDEPASSGSILGALNVTEIDT